MHEHSDWVALGPGTAEHVGSHLWLPRFLGGPELPLPNPFLMNGNEPGFE